MHVPVACPAFPTITHRMEQANIKSGHNEMGAPEGKGWNGSLIQLRPSSTAIAQITQTITAIRIRNPEGLQITNNTA